MMLKVKTKNLSQEQHVLIAPMAAALPDLLVQDLKRRGRGMSFAIADNAELPELDESTC
jgi:hypothetical protein